MDAHTLRHMRAEHYFPSTVFDRQGRERWEEAGGTDAWMRAKEIARRILTEHEPDPLDAQVDAWIKNQFASLLV